MEIITWDLSPCRWSPAASGPAGPTTAPQVVWPDHVKLLQMVRPAAAGPHNEIFTISFPVSTSSMSSSKHTALPQHTSPEAVKQNLSNAWPILKHIILKIALFCICIWFLIRVTRCGNRYPFDPSFNNTTKHTLIEQSVKSLNRTLTTMTWLSVMQ